MGSRLSKDLTCRSIKEDDLLPGTQNMPPNTELKTENGLKDGDFEESSVGNGLHHKVQYVIAGRTNLACKSRAKIDHVGDDHPWTRLSYSDSCRSFVPEGMQRIAGLRLLLSPMATPEHRLMPSTRSVTVTKSKLPHCGGSISLIDTEVVCAQSDLIVTDNIDLEEAGSPLFDPSVLQTFEKALEFASEDSWPSTDVSNVGHQDVFSSPEMGSDAENELGHLKSHCIAEEMRCGQVVDITRCTYKFNWTNADYLKQFELRCPPGCEEKLVLYFTSLRGIRKTFEDCCNVRTILRGYGIQVDERDVWMHSKFRKELTDVMSSAISVPRLFIKGRYIGGVEEIQHMHEEGVLAKLVEGLPSEWNNICELCGGVRFIPCNTCGGSCKMVSLHEAVVRCPDCNENGLSMCPLCGLQ